MTHLIVISGATATGKSRLALQVAQYLNTIIISADSRQVYREFDLGTAKPSISEQSLVPHYLIDICHPTETLTVAEYQTQAQALITKHPLPLLVGGTGLYIKSITRGLKIPNIPPHEDLRSQLISLGQVQCYAMLAQVDPIAIAKIHPNDQFRTLRALEVYYVTGKSISAQQGENPPKYPILHIGLDCEVEALQQRIQHRTEEMVRLGLVTEVEKLIDKYGEDLPLLNTLGYKEIKQYLTREVSLEKAIELTVLHTRQFAKRQRTWFRAYPEIEWFDANDSNLLAKVEQRIKMFEKVDTLNLN